MFSLNFTFHRQFWLKRFRFVFFLHLKHWACCPINPNQFHVHMYYVIVNTLFQILHGDTEVHVLIHNH